MLNIGYAQEIITPPVGVGLAGYMNQRPNVGMYDDLYAKTVVFDNGRKRCGVLVYDLIDVPQKMHDALKECGRDIVYSISNTAPFADAYAFKELTQCWRTTGDIRDSWESISSIGFQQQDRWAAFHGPGHWGDADMLVVGMVGGWKSAPHFSRLTPDEQYTHITLWAMLASPMLIGCDIALMDDFTRSLLCNFEVNDILQDPLGMRAMPFYRDDRHAVYVKILENGDLAVAMFNLTTEPLTFEIEPRSLGLWESAAMVRDVWRQQVVTLVYPGDTFSVDVAPHGAALYRLSPGNSDRKVITPTHYFPRKVDSPRATTPKE
jgi:alpha-galactosidase